MTVFEDVVKMVNTVRGKEKMFGYKSTLANQFYLAYVIIGGFYTERTIHWQTKLALGLFQIFIFITSIFCIITYLAYGDKNDLQLLLYIVYSTFIVELIYVVEPLLAVYFYSDDIKDSIQMADDIAMKRNDCQKLENEINVDRGILWIIIVLVVSGALFFFSLMLDIALFYEIEKTKDYRYYVVYLPKLEKLGSGKFYFILNLTANTAAFSVYIFLTPITVIMEIFAGICHNEVQHIANDLNSLTFEDITTVEMYRSKIKPKFRTTLENAARDYQHLTRMLNTFRGYYKTKSGFLLSILFYVELSHAINIVLPGTPLALRFREINAFITTATPFFVCCWSGNVIEEMAPTVSFAVYSLPWYWSTTHRQDVYVFLCQTQVPTDQKAMGVYSIQLRTFLRFLNVIQSTVNILRAFVHK